MDKSIDDGESHLEHGVSADLVAGEIVEKRAIRVKLSDEPELGVEAAIDVVGGDEAEYVLVAEALGLVDLALVLPRALISRVERFDGDELAAPHALVDLAEAAFADARVDELDLTRDRSLHALWHARA